MLEVCRLVKELLAPLDLRLHPPASLAPFSQIGSRFFIATLVSELLVLVLPPDPLELLLLHIVSRVVPEVVGASLEFVHRRVLDLLLAVGVERFESGFEGGALGLGELVVHLGESHGASSFRRAAHDVGLAVSDADRNVVD